MAVEDGNLLDYYGFYKDLHQSSKSHVIYETPLQLDPPLYVLLDFHLSLMDVFHIYEV